MEMNIIGFALILLITTWSLGRYKEYDIIENVRKATEYDLLTPSVLYSTVSMRCLWWCAVHYGQISNVVLFVQRTLFHKFCGLFICSFTNLSYAAKFLFQRRENICVVAENRQVYRPSHEPLH